MRFDPEMMRDILQFVENIPAGEVLNGSLAFEGRPQAETNEHMQLLLDDAYLTGVSQRDHKGFPSGFLIRGLTMKGHQFVANARNDTIWKKVLAQAKEKGQSIGITVLNGLLEQAAKKYAGL
jgi:Hypothetical protein (DUF2513)